MILLSFFKSRTFIVHDFCPPTLFSYTYPRFLFIGHFTFISIEDNFWKNLLQKVILPQCPRSDLNKRFLPRAKTTTAWKLIAHRSKISQNWIPPHWVLRFGFFKNWFLPIQKQLYNNYIQTHFTLLKKFLP